MERRGARVLDTASGARGYKVLVPWCFDYMRRAIKQGDVFNPVRCGLDMPEVSRLTLEDQGLSSVSWSDGDLGDEELQSGGGAEVSKGSGIGVAGDYGFDSLGGNAAAEEGNSMNKDNNFVYSGGLENYGATTEPVEAAPPSNFQGFQCNGAAEESNLAGKGCTSECFRTADGTIPGCHKGRKLLATWRFGCKPENKLWSGSDERTDLPSMATDESKQCASSRAGSPSGVTVSAARDCPSVKVKKETGSVSKKRKSGMDGRHQPMQKKRNSLVRENVLTTLREFRVIYKKLLEEEETKWRERGYGLRPDLAAFSIYKERLCVKYDDQRYVGSIPGVQIGDVFNSNMELSVVGLHRAQLFHVDHIIKKNGMCLAVSIVSYAQACAFNNNLDFLLHVGSTTATSEQNMEGTDLALKNRELTQDQEAQERAGPSEDEETVFAVDAINRGNFARFINHSCTPNLFPQNVLYDHDDKSMPHIMFFAGEDIPPLKELSYDYNYATDEVYDADGNIKKKQCFCGSVECTGWLY
ncbi:hypothetical protein QOZ80_2BG0195010 [Eleusine coracana subsp. coracana]|nr:hypothetical protein QOZ80_2BG0195010 [Eleusine coracana subsp. coracana]